MIRFHVACRHKERSGIFWRLRCGSRMMGPMGFMGRMGLVDSMDGMDAMDRIVKHGALVVEAISQFGAFAELARPVRAEDAGFR